MTKSALEWNGFYTAEAISALGLFAVRNEPPQFKATGTPVIQFEMEG